MSNTKKEDEQQREKQKQQMFYQKRTPPSKIPNPKTKEEKDLLKKYGFEQIDWDSDHEYFRLKFPEKRNYNIFGCNNADGSYYWVVVDETNTGMVKIDEDLKKQLTTTVLELPPSRDDIIDASNNTPSIITKFFQMFFGILEEYFAQTRAFESIKMENMFEDWPQIREWAINFDEKKNILENPEILKDLSNGTMLGFFENFMRIISDIKEVPRSKEKEVTKIYDDPIVAKFVLDVGCGKNGELFQYVYKYCNENSSKKI